ncbi:MAG: SEC-C metal-binding domain-containing protein [Solirubrobacteraceae bacterium]
MSVRVSPFVSSAELAPAVSLAGVTQPGSGGPDPRASDVSFDLHVRPPDPADRRSRDRACPWPPGRNEPCWSGSDRKYKKCCGPAPARPMQDPQRWQPRQRSIRRVRLPLATGLVCRGAISL